MTYATFHKARKSPLIFSDRLVLLSLVVALIYLAVNPAGMSGLRLDMHTATKHIPMFILLAGALLSFLGDTFSVSNRTHPSVLRVTWPLALEALLLTLGGGYLRFYEHNTQSFLFMGWYMLLFVPVAGWLVRSPTPLLAVRSAMLWILAISLFMGLLQLPFRHLAPFHELEFLFIPSMLYYVFSARKSRTAYAGLGLMIVFSIFSDKNTGYLVGLICLAYLLWFKGLPWLRQVSPFSRILSSYVATVLGLSGIGGLAYLVVHRKTYLPSGNPQYRLHTYAMMLKRFTKSPLWGNLYTDSSVEHFTLFNTGRGNNILPAHSGILDILGNGGLLGISLWFFGLLAIAVFVYRNVLSPKLKPTPYLPYAHALSAMSLGAIMTYAFNPLLLEPDKAFLVWFPLGLLLGIALIQRESNRAKVDSNGTSKN